MTLHPKHDPMGQAILDSVLQRPSRPLVVHSTMFDDDEMPVSTLLRSPAEMPAIERRAIGLSRGRVLDVGAGAGCHSLALQANGLAVTSIDISPLSTEARRIRGVADARCADFFDTAALQGERYDTILMLMNGIGLAGTLSALPRLLGRAKELLADGGQILADSSDISYVFENEDGILELPADTAYYGEVNFRMTYGSTEGEAFDWLYIDFPTLAKTADRCGLAAQLVEKGEHYDYLARITAKG